MASFHVLGKNVSHEIYLCISTKNIFIFFTLKTDLHFVKIFSFKDAIYLIMKCRAVFPKAVEFLCLLKLVQSCCVIKLAVESQIQKFDASDY